MVYNGPFLENPGSKESHIIIYGYIPSLALGALATALFAIVAAGHAFWFTRYRKTRTIEGLVVLGCALEVVGYIFRIQSHRKPFRIDFFVVEYFLIVCAPVTFSAALYLALSHAVRANHGNSALIPVSSRTFLTTFIAIDIVTTVLQIAGAALIGVSESDFYKGKESPISPDNANHILLAGLAFQVASFTVFLGLLVWIMIKVRSKQHDHSFTWSFLSLLFLTSGMVYIRTIFRMAETAQGLFSYASSHEYLFGVFEFAPVWLAMAIWAARPMARELEKMELMGQVEKRTDSERVKV